MNDREARTPSPGLLPVAGTGGSAPLEARDRTQAVLQAVRMGIVRLD